MLYSSFLAQFLDCSECIVNTCQCYISTEVGKIPVPWTVCFTSLDINPVLSTLLVIQQILNKYLLMG